MNYTTKRHLKKLWFGLIPLAWIGCRFLFIMAEQHHAFDEFSATVDSTWWFITAIFGSSIVLILSSWLAIDLQD